MKRSAGLLMYRKLDADIEVFVFLVHQGGPLWAKKDDGAWSIPKGDYEGREVEVLRSDQDVIPQQQPGTIWSNHERRSCSEWQLKQSLSRTCLTSGDTCNSGLSRNAEPHHP